MVRWTDRPAMIIAVDLGRKATKPTNHIFRNKSMGSLNCLKKRKLEDETEDCVRQAGTMGVFVSFRHTGCILKRAQKSEC